MKLKICRAFYPKKCFDGFKIKTVLNNKFKKPDVSNNFVQSFIFGLKEVKYVWER